MADIGAALSTELTRIIECPYPASLSGLAKLLTRANVSTIRACIHDRSRCAVSKLATIVYNALSLPGDYTMPVLHGLCHALEFRDELLLLKPGFLNGLLSKANSSLQNFEHSAGLCVLILSRPLPEAIPLPAAAQIFFLNVFKNANQNPNVDTLKPVYYMLNGACGQLRSLLPGGAQREFDSQLCSTLSSNTAGNASMLVLWTCGIVLFAEHPEATPSGQKLFGSTKKLYKTIYITALNVLWALRDEVVDDDAVEGIRIASKVLQFIGQDVRDRWPKSDHLSEKLFERFPSKLEGSGASQPILFEALCFYAMLAGPKHLPREVVARYEQFLLDLACLADPSSVAVSLSVSLPIYAAHIQESTVRTLLSNILEACASSPTSRQLSNLISLIDELTTTALISEALRTNMVHALASNTLQAKLGWLVQASPQNAGVGCCTHAVTMHRQLISATIASLLTIALSAPPGKPKIPQALAIALISKQRELLPITNPCLHSTNISGHPPISIFQQASTPYTGQHLQDWSERLNSELKSQGLYQRDAIMRSVAQICNDLETRCNTVEEPLRREKENSAKLEQEISQLNEQISSLQNRVNDGEHFLQGLEQDKEDVEQERDRLEQEKIDIFEDKERISARLEEVETCLEESNRNAREALHTVHEAYNAKEMEFRSMILHHEETLRSRDAQVEVLSDTISQLKESQAQQERDHQALNKQCELFHARLSEIQEMLDNERENTSRQAEENARLGTRNADYEHQLEGMEAELESVTRELNDLEVRHQELEQASEDTVRNLEVKHASDTEAAATRAEEEREKLSAQLQSAIQKNRQEKEAHDQTRRDVQRLQASIPPLQTRIQEQDDKLWNLKRSMLAQFEDSPPKPLAIRSASRSQQEIVAPQTPRGHRRRNSVMTTHDAPAKAAIGTQGITNTAMENLANASFASFEPYFEQGGGPTPKRSRPGPSFRVPAIRTPFTQKPILNSKSVSKKPSPSKRSALRQISPNRRHTTVGFALAENEEEEEFREHGTRSVRKRRGSLQGIEHADFTMDDEFLAGTPLTPGNFTAGTGRVLEEDDGTTTKL